jgi:hypothetical protein
VIERLENFLLEGTFFGGVFEAEHICGDLFKHV